MPGQRGVRGLGDVDAEIDELYANAPDAFTKKRDELAKRLKAEGHADTAASVKSLRKPTQIAYVLNQVARRFADEIGELVDVGRDLARAQRKALRGGDASGDLRAAIGRQREVVRDLTTKTGKLMAEIGVSATGHLDEVAGALQAALVDPVVGAQLEEGRLDKVPAPATGFPGAAPQVEAPRERAIPPPPKSAPRKKTAREKQAEAREEKRRAAERAREESAFEQAAARATRLGEEAADARRTADELSADAQRLDEEAERLAKEAAQTRRAATQAVATAKKTEKAAQTAEREAKRLATKARAK